MKFLSQFYYERSWSKTSEKEVLRMIQDEFPDVPAEDTFAYVKTECAKGKTVSIGECKFKAELEEDHEENRD
jgi:hypothetical protein